MPGLPLFEDGGERSFDEFCLHWKENHRILVQNRMVTKAALDAQRLKRRSESAWKGRGGEWGQSSPAASSVISEVRRLTVSVAGNVAELWAVHCFV